jgi:hypothetical protein
MEAIVLGVPFKEDAIGMVQYMQSICKVLKLLYFWDVIHGEPDSTSSDKTSPSPLF